MIKEDEKKKQFEYSLEPWNNYDDFCLLNGIFKHGFGNWETILDDENIWNKQTQNGGKIILILIKKLGCDLVESCDKDPKLRR